MRDGSPCCRMRGMRHFASIVLVLTVASVAVSAQFKEGDVDRAITMGRANSYATLAYRCTAKRVSGSIFGGGLLDMAIRGSMNKDQTSYTVLVFGPAGRIATEAWRATRAGETYGAAQVTPGHLEPRLYVQILPVLPDPSTTTPPIIPDAITDVAFRALTGKAILLKPQGQPELVARTWKNAEGATVDYTETTVTFDAARVKDLYDASGINLVLFTASGDRSCENLPMRTIRGVITKRP